MCVAFCSPPMLSSVFFRCTLLSSPAPSSLVFRSTHPPSPFSGPHHPLSYPFGLHPKRSLPSSRSHIDRFISSHTKPFRCSPEYRYYSRLLKTPAPFFLELLPTPLPCMRFHTASSSSAYGSISASDGSECVSFQFVSIISPFSAPTYLPVN